MSKFHRVFGSLLRLQGVIDDPQTVLREFFKLVRSLPEASEWKRVRESGNDPVLEEQLRVELVKRISQKIPELKLVATAYLKAVELAKASQKGTLTLGQDPKIKAELSKLK